MFSFRHCRYNLMWKTPAIRHGLIKRIQGTTRIRIKKQDEQVQITVNSNRCGMKREQTEQLLNNTGGTSHGTGVGFKRIDRLRLGIFICVSRIEGVFSIQA